jgi:ribosomal protein L2
MSLIFSIKEKGKYTMINSCWKGKALKNLTFSLKKFSLKRRYARKNSLKRITIFHRRGGSKRLHRRIDLKWSILSLGVVERIKYDPNHSS